MATLGTKLNWLRAGVLGANDGIVSTAGLVMGVSGAAVSSQALLISGIAGLVAGALSMAAGEYVSVSTQRDAEVAAVAATKKLVAEDPIAAQRRLASLIQKSGLSVSVSLDVARELMKSDPVGALTQYEHGLDDEEFTNPWQAALASMGSFFVGALIPLLTIVLSPADLRNYLTPVAVSVALAITGWVSARMGGARPMPATIRNIIWGNLAMLVTFGVGWLVGGNIG